MPQGQRNIIMHELAAYNDGVGELQRHVYIKHTKFQNEDKFYRTCINKLETYVCTCKIIAHAVTKQI